LTTTFRPQIIPASLSLEDAPRPHWRRAAPLPPKGKGRYICPETGVRFYPIPDGQGGEIAVPGATSILSDNDTPSDKKRLADWKAREIAAGRDPNEGRDRGTLVHELLERHIGGSLQLHNAGIDDEHDKITAYASGMERFLRPYTRFIWNEGPLVNGWEHCFSEPDENGERLPRVWSSVWGFAGTPDLIASRPLAPRIVCAQKGVQTVNILSDFKTSTRPYFRALKGRVPQHHMTGWLKYKKTSRQLCGYKLAVEETLGIPIHYLQVIVGLPEVGKAQMFYLRQHEVLQETENFKQCCVRFWGRRATRAAQLEAA